MEFYFYIFKQIWGCGVENGFMAVRNSNDGILAIVRFWNSVFLNSMCSDIPLNNKIQVKK